MRKLIPKRKLKEKETEIFGPGSSRARAQEKLAGIIKREPAVSKVVKKAAQIADLITDQDRADNMRVLREAKNAMHKVYDPDTKRLQEFPDHKIRLAATTLQLAYDEGLPVQRQIVLTKQFESASEIIESVKQSPELLRAVLALQSQGIHVEAAGQTIDIETDVHKSGSESEGDSTEGSEL